jgi:2-methylisocitrate lyase-like PEP mutase family enzyme
MTNRREAVSLPVNVMVMDGVPSNEGLAKLGVARIGYGPMRAPQQEAKKVLSKATTTKA